MIVPVFVPASRIAATNVGAFAEAVAEHIARYRCIVIDCSEVEWIAISGMRALDIASHETPITLVNPNPAVHLMAATFASDVQCRCDRIRSPAFEIQVPRRGLVSVPGGKVAS